jgi:putative transposase
MSRGDRREAIFHDDTDRQEFVRTLGQACLKTGWQVHAYCLMNNHFHLVIETPPPNLSLGMKWLLGTCNDSIGDIVTGVISLADVIRRN